MDVSEVRGGHSPGGERQLSRQPSQLASHVVERPGAAQRGLLEGRSLPPATTPAPVVRAHSASSLPPCIWLPLPPRSPLPPVCSACWQELRTRKPAERAAAVRAHLSSEGSASRAAFPPQGDVNGASLTPAAADAVLWPAAPTSRPCGGNPNLLRVKIQRTMRCQIRGVN